MSFIKSKFLIFCFLFFIHGQTNKHNNMQQYNVINDLQQQIGYKVSQAQLSNKRKDLKQMEVLKPHLKQLQQNSAKLLKDYHEYLSNKERKVSGLPYHMIKKFEILQSNLYDTRKILTNQCRQFQVEVASRDFQKDYQQNFFKKTMKSYDQRRLWLKTYILKNQQKMQIVEQEVKKNVDYQTHNFTRYLSEVDIQRLQHNYEPKMAAEVELLQTIKRNNSLKDRIKHVLGKHKQKMSKNNQILQKQKKQQKQKITKIDFQSKVFHSFLHKYFIEKSIQNTFLTCQLKLLKKQKGLLSYKAQQLKIANDMHSQNLEDCKLEWNIIQSNYKNNRSSILEDRLASNCNFTRTDYFLYLREIHRRIKQKIKSNGLYFQYMLLLPQIQMYKRTKSTSKQYRLPKPARRLQQSQNKKMKQYIREYFSKEKTNIQASRKERQRRRQQQQLENQQACNSNSILLQQLENTPKKQTGVQKQILNQLQEKSFRSIEDK